MTACSNRLIGIGPQTGFGLRTRRKLARTLHLHSSESKKKNIGHHSAQYLFVAGFQNYESQSLANPGWAKGAIAPPKIYKKLIINEKC